MIFRGDYIAPLVGTIIIIGLVVYFCITAKKK